MLFVWYTGLMNTIDSIDIVKNWLDSLEPGTRIQSPVFEGHTWVKNSYGWSRGLTSVRTWILLGFSLRWKIVP